MGINDIIITYGTRALAACIAMTLYGYLRAFVSLKLGDDSGEVKSRLTLNPAKQLDPIGYILALLVFVGFVKPMNNNVMNLKNRKRDLILIAVLPGVILVLIATVLYYLTVFIPTLAFFAAGFLYTSLLFSVYNLIPVYPLDGEKLLRALGSPNLKMKVDQYSNILTALLMILSFMGVATKLISKIALLIYPFSYYFFNA